jgi:hypothetical protein
MFVNIVFCKLFPPTPRTMLPKREILESNKSCRKCKGMLIGSMRQNIVIIKTSTFACVRVVLNCIEHTLRRRGGSKTNSNTSTHRFMLLGHMYIMFLEIACFCFDIFQSSMEHDDHWGSLGWLLRLNYGHFVATLALDSRPKQRVARLRAKWETREHSTCFRDCKECEGMNPHTPK